MMNTAQPAWKSPTAPHQVIKPQKTRRLNLFVSIMTSLLTLGLLPVFLLLGVYGYYQFTGFILPGVHAGGVPLQGLTLDQAERELDRIWNEAYRITAVDAQDPGRSWIVQPSEFGLRVDSHATAAQVFSIGRGQGLVQGVTQMITAYREGIDVRPWVALDPQVAQASLMQWAQVIDQAAIDGDLRLTGETVERVYGQPGRALAVEESLELLVASPSELLLDYKFIPLISKPVEPQIGDVSEAAAVVESLLDAEASLQAYDPVTGERFSWEPTPSEISSWIRIERSQDNLQIGLDEDQIAAYTAAIDRDLGEQRTFDQQVAAVAYRDALWGKRIDDILLIHYKSRSHVVQPGETLVSIGFKVGLPYWQLLDANPDVARRGLVVGEALVVPPQDAMLVLPVVTDKRIEISISQQRMWVYQDGALIREHVVSTGISNSPTLPGIFQVQTHVLNAYASIWDLYMPHFMGIYEATPNLMNGIHGLPILSSGVRLWASVLGQPASYGCIILDLEAAGELYNWAEDGVIVEIRP
jgi:hypothetical protein